MANKHKATKLHGELMRNAEETLKIEQYWHLAGRPVTRIPPKDYHYVEELGPSTVRTDQTAGMGAAARLAGLRAVRGARRRR
jgi:hypothetical protein